MEMLDIFDEQGNPTGQAKDRFSVHRDGLWHRSVHVWIMNSRGKLLIQRRSAGKVDNPNKWDISAAGHVAAGDTPIDTAVREIAEELGVTVKPKQLQLLFTIPQQSHRPDYINNEWNDVYLIRTDLDVDALTLQKEETAAVKFVSVDELRRLIEHHDPEFVEHPTEYQKLFEYLTAQKT